MFIKLPIAVASYASAAILVLLNLEAVMETPAEYYSRKLTDEELVTKLRKLPANRACREAADRIEELTGRRYLKPSKNHPPKNRP